MRDSSYNSKLQSKYLIISILALIVLWQIVALILAKPIIMPTPLETFRAFLEIVSTEWFFIAVWCLLL